MSDFVNDKREVFMLELMIQRKRDEIARLAGAIQVEERRLLDVDGDLADGSNQFQMTSAQAEAAVRRADQATQSAQKKRLELQRECCLAQQRTAIIRSDISKSQDMLETYRSYHSFLQKITPDGRRLEDFYTAPAKLVKELDNLESSNLFLLGAFEDLTKNVEGTMRKVEVPLAKTERRLADVEKKLSKVPTVVEYEEVLTEGSVKLTDHIEKELQWLTEKISRTHDRCMGISKGMSALLMLERIETAMHLLYERLQRVKPEFAQAKQQKRAEERMEEHRLAVAAQKAADQRLKYEQAVERAQMPIKKRVGRPPMKRMLPIIAHQVDPDKLSAEKRERERIEKLLYGPQE
jgi:predicted  nucleic acid-binding Zn-ribbon protein